MSKGMYSYTIYIYCSCRYTPDSQGKKEDEREPQPKGNGVTSMSEYKTYLNGIKSKPPHCPPPPFHRAKSREAGTPWALGKKVVLCSLHNANITQRFITKRFITEYTNLYGRIMFLESSQYTFLKSLLRRFIRLMFFFNFSEWTTFFILPKLCKVFFFSGKIIFHK